MIRRILFGLTAVIHRELNPFNLNRMNPVKETFTGANGELSSKRILSAFLLIIAVALVFIGLFCNVNPLDDSVVTIIGILVGAATGLLGVSNFEKPRFTSNNNDKKYFN